MEHQRGELVPIGEAIGNLSPVQAIRDASPQALHHLHPGRSGEPTGRG